MTSVIIVHPEFDRTWPYTAEHLHQLWQRQGETQLIRLEPGSVQRLSEAVAAPERLCL
jgi:hypothetical protein